jgi:hypothetical protein
MQSSEVGSQLHLTLEKTPKMLGCLRREWAPSCFIVSFKLETDDQILVHKVSYLMELLPHESSFLCLGILFQPKFYIRSIHLRT